MKVPRISYALLCVAALASAPLEALARSNWWSLAPLTAPEPRRSTDSESPIDRFVGIRLRENGLAPNPEAEPRALIRRLFYDLTGLPPTHQEVIDFIHQYETEGEPAYLRWVDRLLADSGYGEKQARHWLDTVRYAESHGYDKDKPRPNAWPYRDYVIRSFNEEKPYPRFVQEQIAGDALFPGTQEGIVALGFLAAGPWDFIGHFEVGEGKRDGRIAKHNDRDDMVAATMNTFMSSTAQCAQCHDHKADPVSMEDYYSLQANFAAVDRAPRPYRIDPVIEAQREELGRKIESLRKRRETMEAEAKATVADRVNPVEKEMRSLQESGALEVVKGAAFGYHSAIAFQPDEHKWVQLRFDEPVTIASIRIHSAHDTYGDIGAGFGFPETLQIAMRSHPEGPLETIFEGAHDAKDLASLDIELPASRTCETLRITATRLAERSDDFIFALAEVVVLDSSGANRSKQAEVSALDSIEAPDRWAQANLIDGAFPLPKNPKALRRHEELRRERDQIYASIHTETYLQTRRDLTQQIEVLEKERAALPQPDSVYAVATEFRAFGSVRPTGGAPRPVHLLRRGDVDRPGALMPPGAPRFWDNALAPFDLDQPDDEQARRAALAAYITDPENPLVWRSIVNRVWAWTMGQGLVASLNDFGRMGATPSHPELLDWLALWFRDEADGSIKALQRLIVTSAAYRRSSANQEQAQSVDASNAYYWRGARRRLGAEELRDSLLHYAGRLNRKMAGPSFKDFVIEKPEHSPHYQYHLMDPADPSIHRRSIYRMIPRSQTQPFLTTWDCADPSQSTPQRNETTTALQALSLTHNPLVVHLSEVAAERWRGNERPITALYQTVFQRDPTAEEDRALSTYTETHGLANSIRWVWNLNEGIYLD